MALRKFIIERDIPNVGTLEREQLREAAATVERGVEPTGARHSMGRELRCRRQNVLRLPRQRREPDSPRHAEMSGFPATKITESQDVDPTTEPSGAEPGGAIATASAVVA